MGREVKWEWVPVDRSGGEENRSGGGGKGRSGGGDGAKHRRWASYSSSSSHEAWGDMTGEISAAWGSEGGKGRSGGYSSSNGSRGKGRGRGGGRPSVSPSGSQASLWSAATGDSVATDQSGDSKHSAHSTRSAGARPSAVAEVTGPAVPTMQSQASKHKQSQPPAVAGQVPPRGRGPSLNERDDVGNIGWFFGNWGLRAAKKAVKDNIDQQL